MDQHFFQNPKYLPRSSLLSQGMTLIEVLVGIGILLLIGSGILLFERTVLQSARMAQTNLDVQQQVRRTLARFSAELRAAKPSASGTYAIESAGTSSIVFFVNDDTATDTERVRYFLATSSAGTVYNVIKKGVTKPAGTVYNLANESITTVVQNMKNTSSTPLFNYYDESYAGTSTELSIPINVSSIRHVEMDIFVQEAVGRGTTTKEYSTHASIRNLKGNY